MSLIFYFSLQVQGKIKLEEISKEKGYKELPKTNLQDKHQCTVPTSKSSRITFQNIQPK